jgi:hypothetical protein
MTSHHVTPDRTTPNAVASKRWQRGRLAAGVAVVYLTLVVAAFVVFFVDYTFVEHEDASFSGVIPYFATAPLSWIGILALPEPGSTDWFW